MVKLTLTSNFHSCTSFGAFVVVQDVACGDMLLLVAVQYHNLHHTLVWENTPVKASAPGQASWKVLEEWLLGTQLIYHHIDLHAAL